MSTTPTYADQRNQMNDAMASQAPAELAEHGAQHVAISPQTPGHSLSMVERTELGCAPDDRAQAIDRHGGD